MAIGDVKAGSAMSGKCRRKGGVRGELRVWMWRRGPWRAASVNAGGFHGELAPSNDDVRLEREAKLDLREYKLGVGEPRVHAGPSQADNDRLKARCLIPLLFLGPQ